MEKKQSGHAARLALPFSTKELRKIAATYLLKGQREQQEECFSG